MGPGTRRAHAVLTPFLTPNNTSALSFQIPMQGHFICVIENI